MPANLAEAYCQHVCTKSFLSLWSYPNPQGKDPSKELCDILVVCEPDVIIISVKDVALSDSGDQEVDAKRWQKKAIDASVKQLHGAQRALNGMTAVTHADGTTGLPLPDVADRHVHLVAVAFGSREMLPIFQGDHGRGFVHICDERSFDVLLRELDTITDFVGYLSAKEGLTQSGVSQVIGDEQDLLAYYLQNQRTLPDGVDTVVLENDLWPEFVNSPAYASRAAADRVSYLWDEVIEIIAGFVVDGELDVPTDLTRVEIGLRAMARESRFDRRCLSTELLDLVHRSRKHGMARRVTFGSGVLYVFFAAPRELSRADRRQVLAHRCLVAKWLEPDCEGVCGLATEQYTGETGFSMDLAYIPPGPLTDDEKETATQLQAVFGYWQDARARRVDFYEYPTDAPPCGPDATDDA